MIKGQANDISKENFNNIHLKVEIQPVDSPSEEKSPKKYEWNIQPSKFAINTTNPIRAIVEHLNVQPNPDKAFIPLSVGELAFDREKKMDPKFDYRVLYFLHFKTRFKRFFMEIPQKSIEINKNVF